MDDEELNVDLDEDILDEDLDDDPLDGDVQDSWRGKKRRRAETLIREREAEAKRLREELEEERQASRQLTERVGKLEGVASTLIDEDTDDPYETELAQLHAERKQIQKQWYGLSAKAREEQQDEFEARMASNEAARTDVAVRRALHSKGKDSNELPPEIAYQQGVLKSEFSDVWVNPKAMQFADGYWKQETATGRDGNSLELRREAMQAARERFKTSTKAGQPNDASTRAKYTGTSSSAAAGGGNRITLTSADRDMADARFPNLPEKERYRRFAQIKRDAHKK